MSRPENQTELYELFGALCNDCITDEQQARLEKLLVDDPAARKLYYDYVDVHLELANAGARDKTRLPLAQLQQELNRISQDEPPVTASSDSPKSAWFWKGISYLAVIAATVLLVIGIQHLTATKRSSEIADGNPKSNSPVIEQYVATLLKSVDCRWSGEHRPQFDGQRLLSRDIRLEEGIAELGFDSGVRIVLQGPARISIDSSSNAVLHSGKLVLHGHESAAPFVLDTPHSTLLDIGTEYGASVLENETTEVHVFSGEVQVKPRGDASEIVEQTLGKGEAAKLDQSGIVAATLNDSKFVREIPPSELPSVASESHLLAYDGFDYQTPTLASGDGGEGFDGPWQAKISAETPSKLRVKSESLSLEANGKNTGGSIELTGAKACARILKSPIRLDKDAVYYVSFLVQKVANAPRGQSQYLGFSFRTANWPEDDRKLHFGLSSENYATMTHSGMQVTVAPPLSIGETYMFVAKIVAGEQAPDQLMLRVYGPNEKVRQSETLVWNCVTPAELDDTVFDQLLLYSAKSGNFLFDEIRIGTTWESVTSHTD